MWQKPSEVSASKILTGPCSSVPSASANLTVPKPMTDKVVTHFERFLRYVEADHVLRPYSNQTRRRNIEDPPSAPLLRHVMYQGRILKSGGKELADKLDEDDLVVKWLLIVSVC